MAERNPLEDIAEELTLRSADTAALTEPQSAPDGTLKELDDIFPDIESIGSTPLSDANTGASKFIWDIPLEISVVIGRAELSVAKLMELESGDVIELNKRISEPLEIIINGQSIALGEITMMKDNENRFGIRITKIIEQ